MILLIKRHYVMWLKIRIYIVYNLSKICVYEARIYPLYRGYIPILCIVLFVWYKLLKLSARLMDGITVFCSQTFFFGRQMTNCLKTRIFKLLDYWMRDVQSMAAYTSKRAIIYVYTNICFSIIQYVLINKTIH